MTGGEVQANNLQRALRTARSLVDLGHTIESILTAGLIPAELHEFVLEELRRDENFQLRPARALVADPNRLDWLASVDRSTWHYWPALRQYLLAAKGWSPSIVRSLEDSSDRIVRQLAAPNDASFDVRGLVIGYVQSGKTSNFTAVIAKAADSGYRLIVVLAGLDKALRRQTNIRLKKELVGYSDGRSGAVPLPPLGKQWHEFTREDLEGDFQPGFANHAALQGTQPVLLVVKKNGPVLRRLLRWIELAPPEVRRTLPMLVIDDEADQASVDTRGTYQTEEDDPDPDYEPPSTINSLIRDLLLQFDRRAYIAYTATPFANVLIPHDTVDPRVGNDLYPKDFIVDLPKAEGYFGAEEVFGSMEAPGQEGLDVIREVPEDAIAALELGLLPESLETALLDFVLAGAARAARGQGSAPATMLIHTSQRIVDQGQLRQLVASRFADLRDEWRYQRGHGIRSRLAEHWSQEFEPVTRSSHPSRFADFGAIEPSIGQFFEAIVVREINSFTGEVLDYEREPSLKAIALGGNRLSRGLTLEGLLTSYFVRRSATYDTLMQMARWFGYRSGYEDLTRVWTTGELADWFSDLAYVEHRLRVDLDIYESQGLTPLEVGVRIWQHPILEVTNRLKRRFATERAISQSYSEQLEQTFKYPLHRLEDLAFQAEQNRLTVIDLVRRIGVPSSLSDANGPVWTNVSAAAVVEFLERIQLDSEAKSISPELIAEYINRMTGSGELVRWTVAVRGLKQADVTLGQADWELPTGRVNQISRSRLAETDSLGVIVDPTDEAIGLTTEMIGRNARLQRSPQEGLLLLYPISRYSGSDSELGSNRRGIYQDPGNPLARDLVGVALSFPKSGQLQVATSYTEGTVPWRPVA